MREKKKAIRTRRKRLSYTYAPLVHTVVNMPEALRRFFEHEAALQGRTLSHTVVAFLLDSLEGRR